MFECDLCVYILEMIMIEEILKDLIVVNENYRYIYKCNY